MRYLLLLLLVIPSLAVAGPPGAPPSSGSGSHADGANCNAGEYPLGVDANGAVQNCTDATTEVDSSITTHSGAADPHGDRAYSDGLVGNTTADTVANIPGAPSAGDNYLVNDGLYPGDFTTGGGSDLAIGWYDGTNWIPYNDFYWRGKKIIWVGTSIPARSPNSYPSEVGNILGATVTNQAFYASHVFWNSGASTSCASNPHGPLGLSATIAEIQAKIDAASGADDSYCTTDGVIRTDCSDACDPGGGEPDYTDASLLGQSYENRIIGKDVDLVIFDHGHNDRTASLGNFSETWVTITGITSGATTVITAAGHGLVAGDSFSVRTHDTDRDGNGVTDIDSWTGYVAASCGAETNCATVAGDNITLNYTSTGTFDAGDSNGVAEYDKSKYYEAFNYVIRALYFDNPDILIAFINPPNAYTAASLDPSQIDNISLANAGLARRYAGPILDMTHVLSVNDINVKQWFSDWYHPDSAARLLIASRIASWIKGGMSNVNLGYVRGPSSSTDNAIMRFDSTTGKIAQDYTSSPPVVSDTGTMTVPGSLKVGASSGFVGHTFEAYGSNTITGLYSGGSANFQLRTGSNTATDGSWITFYASGDTVASPIAVSSGRELGGLRGYGHNGSSWFNQGGRIVFQAAENFSAAHTGTDMIFETTSINDGNDADPRMTLAENGYLYMPNKSTPTITLDPAGTITANNIGPLNSKDYTAITSSETIAVTTTNDRIRIENDGTGATVITFEDISTTSVYEWKICMTNDGGTDADSTVTFNPDDSDGMSGRVDGGVINVTAVASNQQIFNNVVDIPAGMCISGFADITNNEWVIASEGG